MAYSLTLSHVGLFVRDIARMVDFYTRFLGFAVSDRGPTANGEIVFMTRDSSEHHQLVMASGRPAELPFNVVNQLSLRTDDLATLKALHEGLKREPVTDIVTLTHGNAISCYFRDPEYNRVELLTGTPWYVPQPHRHMLDLTLPESEIWAIVEKHVRATPGFRTHAQWKQEIEARIARATTERRALQTA
ncbi:MAG: VOC family protein [Burkholderiales bacterium]|nr:VOC family protein [Burkholderiales bacterium]